MPTVIHYRIFIQDAGKEVGQTMLSAATIVTENFLSPSPADIEVINASYEFLLSVIHAYQSSSTSCQLVVKGEISDA